jgi:hypothetical protein
MPAELRFSERPAAIRSIATFEAVRVASAARGYNRPAADSRFSDANEAGPDWRRVARKSCAPLRRLRPWSNLSGSNILEPNELYWLG